MVTDELEREENFIVDHAAEILPITADHQTIEDLETGKAVDPKKVGEILAEFETKIFVLYKGARQSGKSFLITTDHPGSYNVAGPLTQALLDDERCSSVSVIASGIAGKRFQEDFGNRFKQLSPSREGILQTILTLPVDIAIGTVGTVNGSETIALLVGRVIWGQRGSIILLMVGVVLVEPLICIVRTWIRLTEFFALTSWQKS